MVEIENGIIKSTFLGIEDHGIPTFMLHVEFQGSGQGFGGWSLTHYGISFLEILKTVGVESWEKLPNTPCRVKRQDGLLCAIGHFYKGQWYEPEACINGKA